MMFKAKNVHLSIANLLPFLVAGLTFLLVELGADHPEWIEKYYSNAFYPVIAMMLSGISGIFSFSIWDIFWTLFILILLYVLGKVIFRRIKFGIFLLRTLQLAALLYTFFYLSWGYNYFRQPIEKRLNWTRHIEKKDMFPTVLDSLISNANASRV